MKTPTLLTIILNYKTPDLTIKSAEAALREMEGIAGEIVIVDNASGDGSYEQIARAIADRGWSSPRLRLVQSGHNGGFGAGNNFGIRQGLSDGSAPDYVYLLNSDAWPDAGAIRALVEYLEATPPAGMAGSFIHGDDAAPHTTLFRFPSIAGEFEGAVRTGLVTRLLANSVVPMGFTDVPTKVDWVAGASVMMRRTMLDAIGLFDETFFLYYEETDLCLRARRAGWEVHYVPASSVTHLGSVSTGMKSWARTPDYWFESRLHYFTKNHGKGYAALATLARATGAALWRLRVLVSHKPLGDPPGFLRDLIAHSLRHALGFKAKARPAAAVLAKPVQKEGS